MAISKITTGSISDSVAIDTDTLVVDGTNNRVGVGTVSPEAKLHISTGGGIVPFASSQIVSESAGNNYIELNGGSTSTTAVYFGDSSDQDAGGVLYNHSNDSLSFRANAASRMLINNSGHVTMPYQPAFTASGGSSPVQGAGVIQYSSTSQDGFNLNVGSHYNTSNYRFTAPVSGHYFFCFNAYTNSSNGFDAAFRVNGSTKGPQIQDLSTRTGSNTYVSLSVSTIIPLNANDYVDVATTYQAYVDSNCFFSGYLIS